MVPERPVFKPTKPLSVPPWTASPGGNSGACARAAGLFLSIGRPRCEFSPPCALRRLSSTRARHRDLPPPPGVEPVSERRGQRSPVGDIDPHPEQQQPLSRVQAGGPVTGVVRISVIFGLRGGVTSGPLRDLNPSACVRPTQRGGRRAFLVAPPRGMMTLLALSLNK